MKRLLLVGGGHAHLHILARLAESPLPGTEVTLISACSVHHYSGMVPGFLQGEYVEEDLRFDLRAIAERAGVDFVLAWAERLVAKEGRLEVSGATLRYDLLSLNIGSEPLGLSFPGVSANAYTIRPMSHAVRLHARLGEMVEAARGEVVRVTVVGGGAAGVEIALALHQRLSAGGVFPDLTLVEAGSTLLPGFSQRVRVRARRILENRGVSVLTDARVVCVSTDAVHLATGSSIPSSLVVWLTGAAAPALIRDAGLPTDARGFLVVDDTLRAVDGSPIWGAGDCVALARAPNLAKAGVYAVREAPVLDANLRAALQGRPFQRYRPQRSFLALLNTADGRALLRWGPFVGHSRAAFRLKDRIDRAFVRRYQRI